ncbi:MAG: hypothetical protein OHK0011_11280 [Turneriella sp.]
MRLTTEDVAALLGCISGYFRSMNSNLPEFGIPYRLDTNQQKYPLFEYSGHIGISGSHRGGLVITCERELIAGLLQLVLGNEAATEEDIINMIAEMANTVSGNARVHFGSGFDISVPTVVVGEPEEFKFVLAEPTLVIPFTWRGNRANAIIGLT